MNNPMTPEENLEQGIIALLQAYHDQTGNLVTGISAHNIDSGGMNDKYRKAIVNSVVIDAKLKQRNG